MKADGRPDEEPRPAAQLPADRRLRVPEPPGRGAARGQIRRKALDATIVVAFNTAIASPPTEGWYEFWLTDEQTAAITCGDKLSDPESLYEWDMELQDAAGNVTNTFWGVVRVKAEVTRP